MTRLIRSVSLLVLLGTGFSISSHAATRTAATCNASDVQTAANSAVAGDTVVIPAGTCTWTTTVYWTAPANVTMQGAGSQSTVGGGDATVIIDNISRSAADPAALDITTNASGSFRLTGLTFQGNGGGSTLTWNGTLRIGGKSQQFRMDHMHINQVQAIGVLMSGQIYGVIDHCLFDMVAGTKNNGIKVFSSGWNGKSYGDGSWADPTTLGSNRFVFIEDTVFNQGIANDCMDGGRFVFRHNTLNNTDFQTHPTGSAARARGCRAWELYANTFVAPNTPQPRFNAFFLSSGTGVIWGNTASTGYQSFVSLHSMRRDSGTYPESATPSGWGYCGTSFNGVGSAWDQNTSASNGYACLDQPGQGVSDLLSGDFPNAVNTVTGNIAWPHQALEPIYEWLDNWNPVSGWPGSLFNNYDTAVLVQNRDYYTNSSSFNGTSGVGSGLLSARPTTCTASVAYWATDTNTLYKCGAGNTWSAYYTPYTYPHPLAQSGTQAGPAPPTSLTSSLQD